MCIFMYVCLYLCACVYYCVCACVYLYVCVCMLACLMVISHVVRLISHHSRLDYPMNRCVRDSGLLWLDFQSLGSRTWLLGLGLWCSADQSCYRDSRLILCVVCVGLGGGKK